VALLDTKGAWFGLNRFDPSLLRLYACLSALEGDVATVKGASACVGVCDEADVGDVERRGS
jgi:hypothetical protein